MNFKSKVSKSTLLVIVLFGLLTLLFFFKPIFLNPNLLFVSDLQLDFVTQFFAANSVRNGTIPLWDPYYYGPFLAYYNSAVFYPLNLLMYFLFNLNNLQISFNIFMSVVILHYVLGAFFMYLLMKQLKVSNTASFLSGITYSFCGFMIGQMVHVQMLYAAAYAPLLFYFIIKALRGKSFWIVYAGLTLGVMFFTGHPQPTIFYCFLALILCIYEALKNWKVNPSLKSWSRPLNLYLICSIIAFSLAAIQLIPFFEFIPYSLRSQTTYEGMFNLGSIAPAHLISLVAPGLFGGRAIGYWGVNFEGIGMHETNYYLGIHALIILLFLLFSVPLIKRRYQYLNFFIFTAIISLFLMLGRNTILSAWFYLIPGLNKMRISCRIGSVFNFSFAILVGFGFNILLKEQEISRKVFRNIRKLFLVILIFILGWSSIFLKNILKLQSLPLSNREMLINATHSMVRFGILFAVLVLLIFFYLRIKRIVFKKILIGAFILCAIFDIFSHQIDFYPRAAFPKEPLKIFKEGNSESPGQLKPLDLPEPILKDNEIFRIRMPNLYDLGRFAQINKIFSLGYGGAVAIARLSNFRKRFENPSPMYGIINPASSNLDFYNVKYFYSTHKLEKFSDKYQSMQGYPNWYINNKAFPRAFCVNKYIVVSDDNMVLNKMTYVDLKEYVILPEEPRYKYIYSKNPDSFCKIINYTNNEVDIYANIKKPSFVVLSDVWYPGWKAYIDNKLTRVYRANYTFRAIEVPPGKHKIRFVYDPFSFKLGTAVTTITVIFLIIFLILKLRKQKYEA